MLQKEEFNVVELENFAKYCFNKKNKKLLFVYIYNKETLFFVQNNGLTLHVEFVVDILLLFKI